MQSPARIRPGRARKSVVHSASDALASICLGLLAMETALASAHDLKEENAISCRPRYRASDECGVSANVPRAAA